MHSPKKFASNPDLAGLATDGEQVKISAKKRKLPDESAVTLVESFKNEVIQMLTIIKDNQEEEFKQLRKEISEIKNQNQIFQTTVQTKVEELDKQNLRNQKHIEELEDKIEEMERRHRNSAVEIRGIPFDSNEELSKICTNLCDIIGLTSSQNMIKNVYRTTRTKNPNKPIVLELPSVSAKKDFMKLYKTYNVNHNQNRLNSEVLKFTGNKNIIYISEHLTTNTRKTFYLARNFAKNHCFKYCWTSNGRVFLRKAENHPALLIRNLDDLKSHEPDNE